MSIKNKKEINIILRKYSKYKSVNNKKLQQIILLKSNKVFLGELRDIYEKLGKKFFKITRSPKEKEDKSLHEKIKEWKKFCYRWNIKSNWDGRLKHLNSNYLSPNVKVVCEYINDTEILSIRVNNWATIEDIRSVWNEIEFWQNELFGNKEEERHNFVRDWCWYKLSKECNLKPREIAKLWYENFPEEIDLLVIRRLEKNKTFEDIKKKAYTNIELLKEIKEGSLSEHKSTFEEEKETYITGKIKKSNDKYVTMGTNPFVDLIKKAIKRVKVYTKTYQQSSLYPDDFRIGHFSKKN